MNGSRVGTELPELGIVRVLTPGGPYRSGDVLSIAFCKPTVARLTPHAPASLDAWRSADASIPETISAVVTTGCETYALGDELTLAFIDPHVARIHRVETRRESRDFRALTERVGLQDNTISTAASAFSTGATRNDDSSRAVQPAPGSEAVWSGDSSLAMQPASDSGPRDVLAHHLDHMQGVSHPVRAHSRPEGGAGETCTGVGTPVSPTGPATLPGVIVRLQWTDERVRRFIALVDKLFTIERLGWYRHVLTMRLLVPDEIIIADPIACKQAMRHVLALRAAATQTLGNPLLAAFMPNFSVSADWLDTLDSAAAARSIAELRDTLLPIADDGAALVTDEPGWTVGVIRSGELQAASATNLEALLPIFIPSIAHDTALGARLCEYRQTLVTAFGQMVGVSQPVRLGAMTQPHHALDDRLWQLVGAIAEAWSEALGTPNHSVADAEPLSAAG